MVNKWCERLRRWRMRKARITALEERVRVLETMIQKMTEEQNRPAEQPLPIPADIISEWFNGKEE